MIILGIETSCDETAICLLEIRENNGFLEYKIINNLINSQIDIHREYGGVFPTLAKREHIKNLPILYERILKESNIQEKNIDIISVTNGPGLEPALWTGILFAKELGKRLNIKVNSINHMEGHIVSTLLNDSKSNNSFNRIKNIEYPALALLISGGHTEIVKIEEMGKYNVLGKTVDDAIGEAFDKVARMLNLPYPGGPEISRLAELARKENIINEIKLPRPMIYSKDYNFSFSGLKTSVLYTLKKLSNISENQKKDLCREFENSVTEVLISKTKKAIESELVKTLIIGGGVIANTHIRKSFEELAKEYSIPLLLPAIGLTGDNALMIALVSAIKPSVSSEGFRAEGNLSL